MIKQMTYLILGIFFFAFPVYAEDPPLVNIEKSDQLVQVNQSLAVANQDLKALNDKLSRKDLKEPEKKSLVEKKAVLIDKIQKLTESFEEIATGGYKIIDYSRNEEPQKFNWQEELIDIFKPMLAEMKALTERPRAIEALRTKKEQLEQYIAEADSAVKKIAAVKTKIDHTQTSSELASLESEWIKRLDETRKQLQLTKFQLDEKLNPEEAKGKTISDKLYEFFTGRGLTLILAIVAFTVSFLIFAAFGRVIGRSISRREHASKLFFQRALRLGLQVAGVVVSLLVTILVLYVRGDWLIMGFILIIVFGVAWALRQSLPRYVKEAKLMLNMGPVREGERVNFNGIPWRVANLNFYTEFVNPMLEGGSVKLPVSTVTELYSRPFARDEQFFPSNKNDYVILADGTFGKVILQTPDIVQMGVMGSTRTMATTDYLGQNPRNLSTGFGVFVTFGLDYALQSEITKKIPEILQRELNERIKDKPYFEHMNVLQVEFKEASASSLDVLVISTFKGEAAGDYFGIGRFYQSSIVDMCNENNWNIPFQNITVHLDRPM